MIVRKLRRKVRNTREKKIREQEERNRRMRSLPRKERERIAEKGASVFGCRLCHREVVIGWANLGPETPICRECNSPMYVVTACYRKGVLPRV